MLIDQPLLYIGPNRRCDRTVIEWPLQLTEQELQALRSVAADALHAVRGKLEEAGCALPLPAAAAAGETGPVGELGQWVADIAIVLQQAAGHRVQFTAVLPGSSALQCRLVFEYEHSGVGLDAGEIALWIISAAIPGLDWQPDAELPGADLRQAVAAFGARAAEAVLPLDAQAIVDAAARLDVPCVKLEREPYGEVQGSFRVRRNGLLKLGHARYQRVVDGTLCIDRNPSLVPLLFDRDKLFQTMSALGLPAARQDREFRHLITARRAIRAAERIGYPVVLKPAVRARRQDSTARRECTPLHSAQQLREAFEQLRSGSQPVIVEGFVEGRSWRLLLSNHQPLCALAAGSSAPQPPTILHPSTLQIATRASQALGCGLLALTLVTPDPARALADAGGAFVGLDPAPRLDQLLAGHADLMARAAEGLVRCLFPAAAPSRIPLVAVTGTNGKTTTSRMIARIMGCAGHSPGMASTSGVYLNEKLRHPDDQAGSGGHHHVLESREVDMGVLETARGGVAHSGFMFDWCDVAVCLNVTADHFGEYAIDTLEQMIALKRSVLERARRAVVLNADYASCRQMLPFGAGVRVCMASLLQDAGSVAAQAGQPCVACVLEKQGGEEWIVLYEPQGARRPVMPVAAIPATLKGTARFNISNAQHAICACHALGVDLDVISGGLQTFEASFVNNPGRLNIYRGLPFTVIMDYAHNPDGMNQLCAFVDQMQVTGRKILLFAGSGNLTNETIANFAHSAVGHFDYYFCRDYPNRRGRSAGEVPALMKSVLLGAGVGQQQITLVDEKENGARLALAMARAGDLVVLSPEGQEMATMWQEIVSFQPAPAD
jgi:UDP-N-acetylmuramyl tripeptide synthase